MTWGLLQLGWLAWVFFTVLFAIVLALVVPRLREPIARLDPATRVVVLRALLVAPLVGGGLAAALCFVPKLFGAVRPALDHCMEHGDAHVHFCLRHPPEALGGIGVWVACAIGAMAVVGFGARRLLRLRGAVRASKALIETAEFDAQRGVWVVRAELPVALSIGGVEPRTVLSTGLLRAMPARLVDVVVAHEEAHALRHDGWWTMALSLASWGHLPFTVRGLEADLQLACEQACDEHAGAALGDRVRVAEALVAMARLRCDQVERMPLAFAFGASGTTETTARVEALLAPPAAHALPDRRTLGMLVAASAILAVVLADPLHHWTETLLHFVLG